jgi:hypothetical protein
MSVVNDPRTSRTAVSKPQVSVDTGGPAGNDPDEALGMKSSYLVYEHNLIGTGLDVEVLTACTDIWWKKPFVNFYT